MKLEHFPDGNRDCPLLLLFGGGSAEVALLREALRPLTGAVGLRLALHELPFVVAVEGCALWAVSGPEDVGVVATRGRASFTWTLDPEGWLQTFELLAPFLEGEREDERDGRTRFQYLNKARGPNVLYSTARGW